MVVENPQGVAYALKRIAEGLLSLSEHLTTKAEPAKEPEAAQKQEIPQEVAYPEEYRVAPEDQAVVEPEPTPANPAPQYTVESMRPLVHKAVTANTAAVVELFAIYGAKKISQCPPEALPEIAADLERIIKAAA